MRLIELTEGVTDRKYPRIEPWSLPTWPERKNENKERAPSSENASWRKVRSHFK